MSLERGVVRATRAWGTVVRLESGQTVLVKNGLGVRTPPEARVLVSTDDHGRREIISRVRR